MVAEKGPTFMPTSRNGSSARLRVAPSVTLAVALLAPAYPPGARAATEVPAVSPGLNSPFVGTDVSHWQGIFERPGREVFDQRFRIVQATGVRPGMTVADVGAGTGLFTVLFARAVGPKGKVYAVDISKDFVADIERRAAAYHVGNVAVVLSNPRDTLLPWDSVDLAFICDSYHHFAYPRPMLSSVARALKPDGELIVVDFRRIPGVSSRWVMQHVRAGEAEVTKEIKAAGFELIGREGFLRENYFLRFRKAPQVDQAAPPGPGKKRPPG
jgi:ubiquinone/menaquinone biosynthesis C-methylase UbiE